MQQKYVYTIEYKGKIMYVGSTSDFNRRKGEHKNICFNQMHKHFNYRIYRAIRKLAIKEDTFFSKLTFSNLGSFTNFLEEENRLIKELNPIGNSQFALFDMTKREEYEKEYYQQNKTVILQKQRLNSEKHLEAQKRYRDLNKEKRTQYQREYRAKKKLQKVKI